MEASFVELGQSALMAISVLLLAPIWRVLGRIEKKYDRLEDIAITHERRISHIEGRDDKLRRGK